MKLKPKLRFYDNILPKFEFGQEVFYVSYDNDCPAAKKRRWNSGRVSQIAVTIAEEGGKQFAFVTDYGFSDFSAALYNNGNPWKEWQLYETQAEVEKLVEWFPVNDISDEDWMAFLGDRGDDRKRLLDQANWEADILLREGEPCNWRRGPNQAKSIPIENCEMPPCCGVLSDARDILLKCRENNGLIERDRQRLVELLDGSGHLNVLEGKIGKQVAEQLKLNLARETK